MEPSAASDAFVKSRAAMPNNSTRAGDVPRRKTLLGQVRELFHSIRGGARDAIPTSQQGENIEAAEKLLDQLADYYEE